MSHAKADQIAFHFFTKLFYAINHARATEEAKSNKIDKWFNLETPDSDLFTREAREPYRNISQAPPPGPPPLEIQVLLSVPELTNNQVLVYMPPDSSRVRIEPTPKFILLEKWTLNYTPNPPGFNQHANTNPEVVLPIIYKHGIVLFRSIFSLLRILPAWKFYKRLKRRTGGVNRNGNLGIQLRVRSGLHEDDERMILGFDVSPSPTHREPLKTSNYTFPAVPHLLGTLTLSATYLDNPNFQPDELESLLSSRFISLDLEGFMPTLDKNRQRDSITGSSLPTSSGIRSALSRSPPKAIGRPSSGAIAGAHNTSVAERFILPSRVASVTSPSLGTSASTGTSALIPPPRPFPSTNPSATTVPNVGSIPSQPIHPSGLAINRLRKESLNSSSSSSMSARDNPSPFSPYPNPSLSSLSSSHISGPLPIRRPSINPVHPFKSNTLSSASGSSPSLSIRQGVAGISGSPVGIPPSLSGGVAPSTHSRQGSSVSPMSNVTKLPPSPIGSGFGARPSPPANTMTFAPSSLGDRRPGTSGSGASSDRDRRSSMNSIGMGGVAQGDTEPVPMPPRKRYSSSFGHRYVGSAGSSTGVPAGSGSGSGVIAAGQGEGGGEGTSGSGRNTPASAGPEGRKEGVTSYFSATTDDDDISVFVQDIDSRKPLSGRVKEREKHDRDRERDYVGQSHGRETTDTTVKGKEREGPPLTTSPPPLESSPAPSTQSTEPARTSTSPSRGPMLTSQGEVDERLSKMKETFLKSLEGLGGGSTRRKEKDKLTATPSQGSSNSSADPSRAPRGVGLGVGFPSRERDSPQGDGVARTAYPFPYNNPGLGRGRHGSTSSSTLGNSEAGASQGSQEVIGRMDLYEERRRSGYQG